MFLRILAIFLLFFSFVSTTFAQVEISEIMYDLEGPDDPYEWIEIYNNNSNEIDLSDWRFNDGDNHKFIISEEKGGRGVLIIASFSYAIIADDANTFISKYPSFSGTVIDTVMSLNNTFDVLQIKDTDGITRLEESYDSSMGANGDGNSLQKVNGSWCAGAPTPGVTNVNTCAELPGNDVENSEGTPPSKGGGQEQEPPAIYSSTMPSWAENPKISTYAGARKRVVVAGASTDFVGKAGDAENKPLLYARYLWSFGDGSNGEGNDVTHTYYYPGEYVVVLNASSGGYAATDRVSVEVIPADIVITNVSFGESSFVEIHNKTSSELDLSKWKIRSGKQIFTIPQDTFIKSGKKIIFPEQVTKLSLKDGDEVSLLYPSGDVVTSYGKEKNNSTSGSKVLGGTQLIKSVSGYTEEEDVNKNEETVNKNTVSSGAVKSQESSVGKYVNVETNKEEIKKKELVSFNTEDIAQAGSVSGGVNSQNKETDGLFWGIMGISLISLVAIYGVLVSKEKKSSFRMKGEAELYNIIEIKD